MKISRLVGILLTVVLALALALSITACKEDDKKPNTDTTTTEDKVITGVSFTNASFVYDGTEKKLEITGTLPQGVSVSYENNAATDAGTYNASATLSGEGYKTATLNATLTIEKADIEGITFDSASFVYDGSEHTITAAGDFPEGAQVSYEGNAATDAGVYAAKLSVTHKNYNDFEATATLTISKATITGVTLTSETYTYEEGVSRVLEYVGTLPEGVSAEWTGNDGVSEIGSHPVSLLLSGKNYETLELSAFIIIEAPAVTNKDIEGVELLGGEFTYDGTVKSLAVSGELPEGVSVTYAGNDKVNAGTYSVTAVLRGEGYNTKTLTAELKINKAVITGVTLEDGTFTYAENVYHSLSVSGTLPEGATVEYTGNGVTNAGTYKVTAVITGDNYETLVLEATLTVTGSSGGGILTPPVPF